MIETENEKADVVRLNKDFFLVKKVCHGFLKPKLKGRKKGTAETK